MASNFFAIDARSSRELQAVLLSVRAVSKDVNKLIRFQSKRVIQPEWQKGVNSRVRTEAEQRILGATARATVTDRGVKLTSGSLNKRLSGGFSSSTNGAGPQIVEFGGNKTYYRSHKGSRRGKAYTVRKRHTQRQLTSSRKQGPVYNTAENIIPRAASLWAQSLVKVMHDASEGNYRG